MLANSENFIYPCHIIVLVITMIGKIRKMLKEKAGVSPIIAIILMVAITVVLAATIYVWVSGMGKTGTGGESLSALYITKDTTAHNATFQVSGVSSDSIPWADITAQVVSTDGTVTTGTLYHSPSSETYVGAGQTFTINAGSAGTYYFQLVYGGNVIWKSSIAYAV